MNILRKFVSTLLIATFVLGNAACLCEASAAVDSTDAVGHAHHANQVVTGGAKACPHVDCTGDCATLLTITADISVATVATVTPRSKDHDEPTNAAPLPADQVLFGGSPIYSFLVHAPPVLRRATPVSRFDRLLD